MPLVSERLSHQKVIVAVDFGTTYSGIAWGLTGEVKLPLDNIIQHWPDKNCADADDLLLAKSIDYVPTTLKYQKDGSGSYRWGYQIETKERRHEWFKLGLDPSMVQDESDLASMYPGNTSLPLQQGGYKNTSITLTTDYLRALHAHVENMLRRTLPEAALKRSPREYVITVPAVWTNSARDVTSVCATKAGMGSRETLHIVSEPEAAAIYSFKEMNSCGLGINDTFVLCDAGGGTVDLISYIVTALAPMFQLKEAAPGSGRACGSTFLNRIFAEYLNKKFKGDEEWESEKDIFATAMEHFENKTKIEFNGKNGDAIPVHGVAPRNDIKRGRRQLSNVDLQDIFDPVIREVLKLIKEQIQQTPEGNDVKLILLVGGFGNSFYLRNKIKKTFGSDIEVMVAPNSQTAVVRGALMKGLAEVKGVKPNLPRVRLESRKARKHYGTECFTQYNERGGSSDAGHSPERRQWLDYAGGWYVQYMNWFLNKGDTTRESEPAVFEFQTDHLVSAGPPKHFSIEIFCYADERDLGAPQYRSKDVIRLGSVTANIGDIDHHLLKQELGKDNQKYYILDFDIEMTCFAARLEFTPVYRLAEGGVQRFPPARMKYASDTDGR